MDVEKSGGSCTIILPHQTQISQIRVGMASSEQCRMHTYAFPPQNMNVLKYFLYIQYGCGEEVWGVVQPQPCQRIIISPHHPQITQIWVNLLVVGQQCNSVRVHPYAYPQPYKCAQSLSIYTK